MIPHRENVAWLMECEPRMRGDDPAQGVKTSYDYCEPRMRGDDPHACYRPICSAS